MSAEARPAAEALAHSEGHHRSEIRDGMRIDWNVPIEMDDGLILRADVFRPTDDKPHPVILTYGPYAKGLARWDFDGIHSSLCWSPASHAARLRPRPRRLRH